MDSTLPAQPTTMIPSVANTSPDQLVMAKRKRNIILGSVMGGLVVVIVAIVLIYLFVFRPRVYYGNHILITTMQTPGSCTDKTEIPPPEGSNQQKLQLQPTYNCRNATTKDTTGQSVPAPNLMPSGPLTRYTMISRSLQPFASVGCAASIQMPCMLVTPTLQRHGLVHEGDAFMIWEPINNMYLYQVDCPNFDKTDNTTCVNSGTDQDLGLCGWDDTNSKCTLQGNAVPLIFRPLPDDFKQQMADAKNHPTIQGFLFSFASKKPTKNMLRIRTNYLLTSLVSSNLVQFNVNVNNNHITLQEPSDQTDDTFNWQILKE